MATLVSEIISTDADLTDKLTSVMEWLRQSQSAFQPEILNPPELVAALANIKTVDDRLKAAEVFSVLDQMKNELRGTHELMIVFTEKVLDGNTLGNLFSSMQQEDGSLTGLAVVSTRDVDLLTNGLPIESYLIQQIVSVNLRWVVRSPMLHESGPDDCLFHKRIDKRLIANSVREMRLCDQCREKASALDDNQWLSLKDVMHQVSKAVCAQDPQQAIGDLLGSTSSEETRAPEQHTKVENLPELLRSIMFFLKPANWREYWIPISIAGLLTVMGFFGPVLKSLVQRSPSDDVNKMVQARVNRIVRGTPIEQCRADPGASTVQLFEHGWLVARFESHTIYSIVSKADGKLHWTKTEDNSSVDETVKCEGVLGENFLQWGFRKTYCSDRNLQTSLGPPVTREQAAWVQYQYWDAGLLITGLPGTAKGINSRRFNELNAVFLDGEYARISHSGRRVRFTPNNTNQDVYCNASWYPPATRPGGFPILEAPESLKQRKDCLTTTFADTYVLGRSACSYLGF